MSSMTERLMDLLVERGDYEFTGGSIWLVSVHQNNDRNFRVVEGVLERPEPLAASWTVIAEVDDENYNDDATRPKRPIPGQRVYNPFRDPFDPEAVAYDRRMYYAVIRIDADEYEVLFA